MQNFTFYAELQKTKYEEEEEHFEISKNAFLFNCVDKIMKAPDGFQPKMVIY
jgi:hypothetical protein